MSAGRCRGDTGELHAFGMRMFCHGGPDIYFTTVTVNEEMDERISLIPERTRKTK